LKATVHTVDPVLPPKENDGCLTVELSNGTGNERMVTVSFAIGKQYWVIRDLLVFKAWTIYTKDALEISMER